MTANTAEYISWNCCPSCKQPVDCDGAEDGSLVSCSTCKREFEHQVWERARGVFTRKLVETYRSQKTVQHRKRT